MTNLFIICGLGNPGIKYANTRHNVGFDTLDLLAQRHSISIKKLKLKALQGEGIIEGTSAKIVLVKPQTYMNLSGESISAIVDWYGIPLSNLIIVYDDVDLPLGKIRIRPDGSSGSHNGMKSVIYQLGADNFPRVRIGIDKQPDNMELANYVLGRFNEEERKIINISIINATDACEEIIKDGIENAMNKFNRQV